jgi:hypothetical protein
MGQIPMRIEENVFWRIAEPVIQDRDPSLRTLHAYWDKIVRNMD